MPQPSSDASFSLPRVELFGGLRIHDAAGVTTHFSTRKTAAVLAHLALHLGQPQSRVVLGELLWPGVEPNSQLVSLSTALSALRRQLEPASVEPGSRLLADRQQVTLRREGVTTDVSEFETLLRAARGHPPGTMARAEAMEAATRLYKGALLTGFYDDWVLQAQARYANLYLEVLLLLVETWEAVTPSNLAVATDAARRALEAEPLSEAAHLAWLRLLGRSGQTGAALQHYAKIEARFAAELNAEPSAALQRMAVRLRRGDDLASDAKNVARSSDRPASQGGPQGSSPQEALPREDFETGGGAVPLDSRFYVERPVDATFYDALDRGDGIVLIKGSRQVGKTSLLARGMHRVREGESERGGVAIKRGGGHVVLTDFQKIGQTQMASEEGFCRLLAATIGRQLQFSYDFGREWDAHLGAYLNLENFVRALLESVGEHPIVWCMDEVDKLFTAPFASDFFGLIRSWHNARSLEAHGPWRRLTLAIAYATEAHLFIRDLNQSPFNVGTRLSLDDFTPAQIADLNRRHGAPLDDAEGLIRFEALVAGQPYLVRCGLAELARRSAATVSPADGVEALAIEALNNGGVFGGHLRRLLYVLEQDADLSEFVREMLRGDNVIPDEALYRLRSAGVLRGETADDARFRCGLYERYLARHLG